VTELLYDLLGLAYWAAIVGGVAWWIWSIRKARRPKARTPRDEAELAGLRAAIDRDRRATAARPGP
jgi:hypothetical protein